MESDLTTVLRGVCARTFPDFADINTALPYITWQLIGGTPLRHVDGSAQDKRHSMLQVNVWAATRAESLTLIRAVEEALCGALAFTARPDNEPTADADADTRRYGCMQDFSVWSSRT